MPPCHSFQPRNKKRLPPAPSPPSPSADSEGRQRLNYPRWESWLDERRLGRWQDLRRSIREQSETRHGQEMFSSYESSMVHDFLEDRQLSTTDAHGKDFFSRFL